MIRILVTGGRHLDDADLVYQTLDRVVKDLHNKYAEHMAAIVLVNGGARGADSLAIRWAKARGYELETHHAEWDVHGRAAGPKRNQKMVDLGADVCVSFMGGVGTKDCTERAMKAGIPVVYAVS